jgi:hypothetical protein
VSVMKQALSAIMAMFMLSLVRRMFDGTRL